MKTIRRDASLLATGLSLTLAGCFANPRGTPLPEPEPDCPGCAPGEASPPASGTTGVGVGVASVIAQPTFNATVRAAVPPPPISGGTLTVLSDGTTAVASDPDRDAVYFVDTTADVLKLTVSLQPGDEPGRVIQDGAGRVHVALRRSGFLVTIDPTTGAILGRRSVCPAPRGIAWDPMGDQVWVACATGELVAIPSASGSPTQTIVLDADERDLRDVIVQPDGSLVVTQFRAATVLRVARDGTITRTDALTSPNSSFVPHVAWRTIQGPSGCTISTHQIESTQSVSTVQPGGYGVANLGGGIVQNFVEVLGADGSSQALFELTGVLPVDVALSPDGQWVAVAAPGNSFDSSLGPVLIFALDGEGLELVPDVAPIPFSPPLVVSDAGGGLIAFSSSGASVSETSASATEAPSSATAADAGIAGGSGAATGNVYQVNSLTGLAINQAIAVAFDASGDLLVQTREPAGLTIIPAPGNVALAGGVFVPPPPFPAVPSDVATSVPSANPPDGDLSLDAAPTGPEAGAAADAEAGNGEAGDAGLGPDAVVPRPSTPYTISLATTTRDDTGHDIFHTTAGALVACASCHPEGRDDGHVWLLDGDRRRTPALLGTIAGTAPYHWPGDEPDMTALANDVYTNRMSGAQLSTDQLAVLQGWVEAIPAPAAPSWIDTASAQRGQALFNRSDVQCSECHSGTKFTDNLTVDIGTGGAFQVPPLVGVSWRAPFLHDGCAPTLGARFDMTTCDTPQHGNTSSLSSSDIQDLINYLRTL